MPLIDIFKKIFQSTAKDREKLRESISIESLSGKIELEEKKNSQAKSEVKQAIKQKIENFSQEMKTQVKILEQISLESRKEQEKIKLVVRENLKLYIIYLNKLIENLKNLENLIPEEYFVKINEILFNFNRNSQPAYEKATILIGELEKSKDIINTLSRNINSIFSINEPEFKKTKIIAGIIKLLKEKKDIAEKLNKISREIENKNKSQQETEKLIEKKELELKEFKSGREYQENLKEKEARKKNLEELDRKIQKIKTGIDLKALAKQFHEIEKTRKLIQNYQDNFKFALTEDSSLELEKLAGINLKEIREKLLEKEEETETDKKLKEKELEIKKFKLEQENIQREILEETGKQGKLKEKEESLTEEIKNHALDLDLEVR